MECERKRNQGFGGKYLGKYGIATNEEGEDWAEQVLGRRLWIQFLHMKFEMPIGHPSDEDGLSTTSESRAG